MGSLTSRPKLPPVQQPMIITVPAAPAPAPVPAPAGEAGEGEAESVESGKEDESARRSAGLLNRSRGRLGTILTGFRGILAPAADTGRKTLLGE